MALNRIVWLITSSCFFLFDSETNPSALALQISSDLVSTTYFAIAEIHIPHGQIRASDVSYGWPSRVWKANSPPQFATSATSHREQRAEATNCAKASGKMFWLYCQIEKRETAKTQKEKVYFVIKSKI